MTDHWSYFVPWGPLCGLRLDEDEVCAPVVTWDADVVPEVSWMGLWWML